MMIKTSINFYILKNVFSLFVPLNLLILVFISSILLINSGFVNQVREPLVSSSPDIIAVSICNSGNCTDWVSEFNLGAQQSILEAGGYFSEYNIVYLLPAKMDGKDTILAVYLSYYPYFIEIFPKGEGLVFYNLGSQDGIGEKVNVTYTSVSGETIVIKARVYNGTKNSEVLQLIKVALENTRIPNDRPILLLAGNTSHQMLQAILGIADKGPVIGGILIAELGPGLVERSNTIPITVSGELYDQFLYNLQEKLGKRILVDYSVCLPCQRMYRITLSTQQMLYSAISVFTVSYLLVSIYLASQYLTNKTIRGAIRFSRSFGVPGSVIFTILFIPALAPLLLALGIWGLLEYMPASVSSGLSGSIAVVTSIFVALAGFSAYTIPVILMMSRRKNLRVPGRLLIPVWLFLLGTIIFLFHTRYLLSNIIVKFSLAVVLAFIITRQMISSRLYRKMIRGSSRLIEVEGPIIVAVITIMALLAPTVTYASVTYDMENQAFILYPDWVSNITLTSISIGEIDDSGNITLWYVVTPYLVGSIGGVDLIEVQTSHPVVESGGSGVPPGSSTSVSAKVYLEAKMVVVSEALANRLGIQQEAVFYRSGNQFLEGKIPSTGLHENVEIVLLREPGFGVSANLTVDELLVVDNPFPLWIDPTVDPEALPSVMLIDWLKYNGAVLVMSENRANELGIDFTHGLVGIVNLDRPVGKSVIINYSALRDAFLEDVYVSLKTLFPVILITGILMALATYQSYYHNWVRKMANNKRFLLSLGFSKREVSRARDHALLYGSAPTTVLLGFLLWIILPPYLHNILIPVFLFSVILISIIVATRG